jgi:DNA-binding Lrp family transcriptional regulator
MQVCFSIIVLCATLSDLRAYTPNDQQRHLLQILELQPLTPVVDLARILGARVHRIHYEIARLERHALLGQLLPLINPSRFGYWEHEVYLSLHGPTVARRRAFLSECQGLDGVTWLTQCAGEFEYFAAFCLPDLSALAQRFGALSARCGAIFRQRILAHLLEFHFYGRKYLWPKTAPKGAPVLSYSVDTRLRDLTREERQILREVSRFGSDSFRQSAQRLGHSPATFGRRLRRLRDDGILVGYCRKINVSALGVQTHKLCLRVHDLSQTFSSSLERYCRVHSNIVSYSRCIGDWDFELRVEVPAPESPALVQQQLQEHFEGKIYECRLIALYRTLRADNFPF